MKTIVRRGRWPCDVKDAREFEHAGNARSVVVSAVMYLAFARRQTAFAAVSEMIVVRADHDRFVFESWIRTVENADDVGGRRLRGGQRWLKDQARRPGSRQRSIRASPLERP